MSSGRFAIAVHVMTVLAYKDGDRVSSEHLAGSVNTNPVVIRRLLLALKRANLVETRRGPNAGSRLSRSAGRINLAEVYRAVEGLETFRMARRKPNRNCPVGHCICTALETVFQGAQRALEEELSRTTLAQLAGIARNCSERAIHSS